MGTPETQGVPEEYLDSVHMKRLSANDTPAKTAEKVTAMAFILMISLS